MKDDKVNSDPEKQDQEKQLRRWRLWEFLVPLFRLLGYNYLRDRTMNKKLTSDQSDNPPMLELSNLAKYGIKKTEKRKIYDMEQMELILPLFKSVSQKDGKMSEQETQFVHDFIEETVLPDMLTEKREELFDFYDKIDLEEVNLKNCCHLIKMRVDYKIRLQVFELLYRLAFLHDIDQPERQAVDRIGRWIELSNTDIRRAAFDARKEVDTQP